MTKEAEKRGTFSKDVMWGSVEAVSNLLESIKEAHPALYWNFMREQYGAMHSDQYGEDYARWDVSQMKWTDREGRSREGEYWTCHQIEEATKGMQFPSSVTKWTKYVAFNASATDLCRVLDDEKILKVAYEFFFKDADWDESKDGFSASKTWEYFLAKSEL